MALILNPDLPAVELLRREGIELGTPKPGCKPLRLGIINLMPTKVATETDLCRVFAQSPLDVEIVWIHLRGQNSKHAPAGHMERFYRYFDEVEREGLDGLLMTGAPLDYVEYEDVTYWQQACHVFEWARVHVPSTLYLCWGCFASLYYFYGLQKYALPAKQSGVYEHRILQPELPLFHGMDNPFYVPHSRHVEVSEKLALEACSRSTDNLRLLVDSEDVGLHILMSRGGREVYVFGHAEYAPDTLNNEYWRDVNKGMDIVIPRNYYPNNDPTATPEVRWRANGVLLYCNWLNYYVAQRVACREWPM